MPDIGLLSNFWKNTESDLGYIVEHRNNLIHRDLQELIQNAWRELQPNFGHVSMDLQSKWKTNHERFVRVGLTGAQLQLKMAGHERARKRWLDDPLVKKPLLSMLAWVNAILGSLKENSHPKSQPLSHRHPGAKTHPHPMCMGESEFWHCERTREQKGGGGTRVFMKTGVLNKENRQIQQRQPSLSSKKSILRTLVAFSHFRKHKNLQEFFPCTFLSIQNFI